MSLFDFVASDFTPEMKQMLFQDQAACLCFFRLSLSSIEQQLLQKLIYETEGIKPRILADRYMCTSKQADQETARLFFKKLQSLDLLTEVEQPQETQEPHRQDTPSQMTMTAFHRQQSLMLDSEAEFMNKIFALRPQFKTNLHELLFTNLKLSFLAPFLSKKKAESDFLKIEQDSFGRWKSMIYFLLQIQQTRTEVQNSYNDLLSYADYIDRNKQLTASGFQFILHDAASQVQSILLAYIKKVSSKRQSSLVPTLQFIFQLALAETASWYKLAQQSLMLQNSLFDLHQLGLITMKKPTDILSKFCVNNLLQAFLTNNAGGCGLSSYSLTDQQQGFIIVESNFKVYAYTSSPLYQAILRLFMREDYKFPNLIVGLLTRESLKEAFLKRISAKQIMGFLQSHAHIQTVNQKKSQIQPELTGTIGQHFGLSSNRGLEQVSQQLEIWEKEMNCVQEFKGVLIKFDNQAQHTEFKAYKLRRRISCWLWNEEWKTKSDNVVVVDIKFEKEAYEFINTCQN